MSILVITDLQSQREPEYAFLTGLKETLERYGHDKIIVTSHDLDYQAIFEDPHHDIELIVFDMRRSPNNTALGQLTERKFNIPIVCLLASDAVITAEEKHLAGSLIIALVKANSASHRALAETVDIAVRTRKYAFVRPFYLPGDLAPEPSQK